MNKPKAVFFGGLPGAGKTSYITMLKRIVKPDFVVVNSDRFAEPMLEQYNLLKMKSFDAANPDDNDLKTQTKILAEAKKLTAEQIEKVLIKRKHMILDATSRSIEEIKTKKEELEKIGYETYFVLVVSDLKTAIERNLERPRSLHPNTIRAMQKQMDKIINDNSYKLIFKNNFQIINNNTDTNIIQFEKMVRSNHQAKNWIDETNIRVVKKIIDWMNKLKPQNEELVAKNISSLLFKNSKDKFNDSIKKIKDSYSFKV